MKLFSTEKSLTLNEQAQNTLCACKKIKLASFYTYTVKREGETIVLEKPEKEESFFVNSAVPEIAICPATQTVRFSLLKSVKVFLIGFICVCVLFEIMLFLIAEFSPVFIIPPLLALLAFLIMEISFQISVNKMYNAIREYITNIKAQT